MSPYPTTRSSFNGKVVWIMVLFGYGDHFTNGQSDHNKQYLLLCLQNLLYLLPPVYCSQKLLSFFCSLDCLFILVWLFLSICLSVCIRLSVIHVAFCVLNSAKDLTLYLYPELKLSVCPSVICLSVFFLLYFNIFHIVRIGLSLCFFFFYFNIFES